MAELFGLAEQLERAPEEAVAMLRQSLATFREEQRAAELDMMSNDKKLVFEPPVPAPLPDTAPSCVTCCSPAAPASSGHS